MPVESCSTLIAAPRRLVAGVVRDGGLASREHVSLSPYWRRGLTDEEWRSVKRDWVRRLQGEMA